MALLEVCDLRVSFETHAGQAPAVRGLSFHADAGRTLAIVGESGSGKSLTALSILRLAPSSATLEGRVMFQGADLLTLSEAEMRKVRGAGVGMVFQEPMTALNPVLRVGTQIAEGVRLHRRLSRKASKARALQLLSLVGIPEPERRLKAYPHQLSGGMRQRVMIAMALACDPALLIADEPTTALDVTVQAQILDLLRSVCAGVGATLVIITHDFGVVAEIADRVIIMYAGRKVEEADVDDLFARPLHPYTRGLLAAAPAIGSAAGRGRLTEIPGTAPAAGEAQPGCAFAPRCLAVQPVCREMDPELRSVDGRLVACHFALMASVAAADRATEQA